MLSSITNSCLREPSSPLSPLPRLAQRAAERGPQHVGREQERAGHRVHRDEHREVDVRLHRGAEEREVLEDGLGVVVERQRRVAQTEHRFQNVVARRVVVEQHHVLPVSPLPLRHVAVLQLRAGRQQRGRQVAVGFLRVVALLQVLARGQRRGVRALHQHLVERFHARQQRVNADQTLHAAQRTELRALLLLQPRLKVLHHEHVAEASIDYEEGTRSRCCCRFP